MVAGVVNEHAVESAFLWILRDAAVGRSHYSVIGLAIVDGRVEAHIDGLRIAGNRGWRVCCQALEEEEPGEVFAAAVLAFEATDDDRLAKVIDIAVKSEENFRGLASALGWVGAKVAGRWLDRLGPALIPIHKRLWITGHAIHRLDPGRALAATIGDSEADVRARALRAVGELKRRDMTYSLPRLFQDEDAGTRFWAAWSAVLMDYRKVAALEVFVNDPVSEFHDRAIQIAFRAMNVSDSADRLSRLADGSLGLRNALVGYGVAGNPDCVPLLLEHMEIPEHARVAGESFSMITGLDLAYEDLDRDAPEDFQAGPTEDPEDENVEMDPDEDLPWPDPAKLGDWWGRNKARFSSGKRYLCGHPISESTCREVLVTGFQRQRRAAALELALLRPEEPLFNTSAPGFRQQEWLGVGRKARIRR